MNGGTPKSRLSAIAAPTNSARSVAMAMISAWIHRPQVTGRGKALPGQLRQAVAGGDADLGRQVLHEHRHQVRGDDHPHQQVAVLGAAGDVGGEVAGVDVGDRGDEGGAEQREPAADAALGAREAQRAHRRRGEDVLGAEGDGGVGGRRRAHAAGTSTRIASASRPPRTWTSPLKVANTRAAERVLVDDLEAGAGRDPALGQVAEHLGVGVGDAHEDAVRSRLERRQGDRRALLHHEVARGDRVAVRVDGGVAELGGDQLLELLREDVLEHLGLVVHAVPRHAEVLRQVELEQPVVAQHLERDPRALGGELHALVGLVRRRARARRACGPCPTPTRR